MLKANFKCLFFIPPEILYHFDSKLYTYLFFSLKGWFISKLFKGSTFAFSSQYSLMRSFFLSSCVIQNICFGIVKTYFKYFQLRGRSFKYLLNLSNLIIKFGFSHKLYYMVPSNTQLILLTKQVLKVSSKSLQSLNFFFFYLHCIRKFDKYKGKGFIYYKDSLVLKASSKKTKL